MLHAIFDDLTQYPYTAGSIFLGKNGEDKAVGLETYRHLITFAGTQAGKGATLIAQNLRRWPFNVFGFDPKGENISLSWEHREALGQRVAAFDPYHVANVPSRLRATFNPLGDLDPEDPFTPSVIESLAEGLTIRYKADDAMWDNGGRTIAAGFIAFCVLAADDHEKHLPAVAAQMRKAFRDPTMYELMADIEHPVLGGLIREAAIIGISAAGGNRQSESYVRSALDQTKWLVTDTVLASWLTSSSVSLRDLKHGKLSFFVCLPFDKTAVRPELLKLLLQYSMSVMQQDLVQGAHGSRCLFLLDEAYCMGRVPDIQRNLAGLTAYGVQIWTIWQNVGQLHELYKAEGAAQFFSAADAVMFFGLGEFDDASARIVAEAIGRIEVRDIDVQLPAKTLPNVGPDVWYTAYQNPVPPAPRQAIPQFTNGNGGRAVASMGEIASNMAQAIEYEQYQSQVREHGYAQLQLAFARELADIDLHRQTTAYNHGMAQRGDFKIPPREVRRLTAKAGPKQPARKMIVFTGSGDVIVPELLPHWEKQVPIPRVVHLKSQLKETSQRKIALEREHQSIETSIRSNKAEQQCHVDRFGKDCMAHLPEGFTGWLKGGLGGVFAYLPLSLFALYWRTEGKHLGLEPLALPLAITTVFTLGLFWLGVRLGSIIEDGLFGVLVGGRLRERAALKSFLESQLKAEAEIANEIMYCEVDYECHLERLEPIKHQTV